MPTPTRPYFRFAGEQLLEVFQTALANCDTHTLDGLIAELTHRNTPKMRKLLEQVRLARQDLQRRPPQPPATPPNPASQQGDIFPELANEGQQELLPSTDATNTGHNTAAAEPAAGEEAEFETNHPADENGATTSVVRLRDRGAAPGAPNTWLPKRNTRLKTPPDLPPGNRPRFIWALDQLIGEMRAHGTGMTTLRVFDGKPAHIDADVKAYQFSFDGDAENLFEGAKVVLAARGTRTDGRIAGLFLSEKKIVITLEEDLGEYVDTGELCIDNTAMLEQLANRLRGLDQDLGGFNETLADAVLANNGGPVEATAVAAPPTQNGLNDNQRAAAVGALCNSVFYVWGPPGTGKTVTLATIIYSLFVADCRVLICSNTNQAVDQVLLKLCKSATGSALLEDGRIVRVGRIENKDLRDNFGPYVSLPEIVDRLGANLRAEKEELEARLAKTAAEQETLQRIIRSFDEVASLEKQSAGSTRGRDSKRAEIETQRGRIGAADQEIAAAKAALEEYRTAGILRRTFLRTPERLNAEIRAAEHARSTAEARVTILEAELATLASQLTSIKSEIERLKAQIAGVDRQECTERLRELDAERTPWTKRLAEVNRELADLENRIVREAMVIGATATKLFLSPKLFTQFDTVVVDEASMVLPPAIYHAAGLSERRVVVSGDFRQLAPIVATQEQAIFDVLGRDVFEFAGIQKSVDASESVRRMQMLQLQYRMPSAICDLVAGPIYGGNLKTAEKRSNDKAAPPAPFDSTMTIIDTSELYPFITEVNGGSKYNLMHAVVARNVAIHLTENGFSDFGLCTSYRSQHKLMRSMLAAEHLDAPAGTVYRFQGDEKQLIVMDFPDGFGSWHVGMFVQGEHPEDPGPRLANVAITRAQAHLILILNLRYLDAKLPNNAIVRGMLYQAQIHGRIIPARDVLALHPSDWELPREFGIAMPPLPDHGLFRQNEFATAVMADLSAAQKSVVIVSAFLTEQRVASYGDMFRRLSARGVKIRCVVRPPEGNGSMNPESTRAALAALNAMGCVIDQRTYIHEKIVWIDEEVVWFGSLNALSNTGKTSELMLRIKSPGFATTIAQAMSIPELGKHDFTDKENPPCPDCGCDTVLHLGKFGHYLTCTACAWHGNPGRMHRTVGGRHGTGNRRRNRH